MDPPATAPSGRPAGLPRTRGDGPSSRRTTASASRASPHTRGWTAHPADHQIPAGGFPAHAGMDPCPVRHPEAGGGLPRTRGDGPRPVVADRQLYAASPHTRGWTHAGGAVRPADGGFPAHAGMDPFPAGGRVPRPGLPRTRGDGPRSLALSFRPVVASPHTRGWTPLRGLFGCLAVGFPAHAGMDPRSRAAFAARSGLPRTRGDGPGTRTE